MTNETHTWSLVDELKEFKDQCNIGLQANHDCPAVYALAYIYGQIDRVIRNAKKLESANGRTTKRTLGKTS